ncbi:conjugal transfer protein TraH [Escherichia coli]|uniref:conjugal transfer protein TraH n=1 Tax=Escherichia coli TaxID=562 RepID=UPI004068AA5A
MLRIKPLLVLCAALLTFTPAASADVNSDMNQFFNKLGFASNTTQPGVWQGQAAGYAYGGSLYARTRSKKYPADFHDAAGYQCRMWRHRRLSRLVQFY